MIPRIYSNLDNFIKPNKVLVIYGPRRVGKTVLLTNYLEQINLKYKLDNGDDIAVQEVLIPKVLSGSVGTLKDMN
jgi:uncharacterized protein